VPVPTNEILLSAVPPIAVFAHGKAAPALSTGMLAQEMSRRQRPLCTKRGDPRRPKGGVEWCFPRF